MNFIQREVYVTIDGLGRAAIVEREDTLFQIYTHWLWSEASQQVFNVAPIANSSWRTNNTELSDLYKDVEPEQGIYPTIDSARMAITNLPGFLEKDISLLG